MEQHQKVGLHGFVVPAAVAAARALGYPEQAAWQIVEVVGAARVLDLPAAT
jgi:hypothetical protein